MAARQLVQRVARNLGFRVVRQGSPPDFSPADRELVEFVRPYTMTSPERIFGLATATRFLVASGVPGDIVECGVWRGGSMMVVARTLLELDAADRDLYLFDTYTGMTAPTDEDLDHHGRAASSTFVERADGDQTSRWCRAGIATVRANLARTGYPPDRLHFVAGMVEQTIPAQAPARIALLRLDTDWYVSTRHELEHLWPRLVAGGVCIIDDYGHWRGSRQAVDEYLAAQGVSVLLHRLDYAGRLIVKP
jgi:O-methyltransferase